MRSKVSRKRVNKTERLPCPFIRTTLELLTANFLSFSLLCFLSLRKQLRAWSITLCPFGSYAMILFFDEFIFIKNLGLTGRKIIVI